MENCSQNNVKYRTKIYVLCGYNHVETMDKNLERSRKKEAVGLQGSRILFIFCITVDLRHAFLNDRISAPSKFMETGE